MRVMWPNDQAQRPPPETPGRLQQSRPNYLNRPTARRGGGSLQRSAGKIKGLRGAKLGNPYLRWAFGEAAVIAKRDPLVIGPLAQRLEAKMNGNKFKANTVLAIKLARAVYYMLRTGTGFDPERLVAQLTQKKSDPGAGQPGRLTGRKAARASSEPPLVNGTPNPSGGTEAADSPAL